MPFPSARAHTAVVHVPGILQDPDSADDDNWNVNKAAATCLLLLAQTVQDAIVPMVMNWASANITSPEWERQEAAIMAFGACTTPGPGGVPLPLANAACPPPPFFACWLGVSVALARSLA